MQAIHEALAAWSTRTSGSASGTETSTSDRFSDIFNTIMERQKSGLGGIGGALEMLASQFAGATVKAGTAAESVEAAEKEIEDETGDVVTVEPEVLDNMSADEMFAQKIKDIIAGLLDTSNQSLLNVNGAYVQRSVSISITVVHYGEYHRSQDNGEILAGVDLQTSLQDRLSEMIKKFFGVSDSEDTEESGAAEETKATEKTKASEEEKESSNRLSNFFGASWNLQVHFSQSLLSNLNANSSTGSANASMYQVSFAALAMSGNSSLSSLLGNGKSSSSSSSLGVFSGFDLTEFLNMGLFGSQLETNGLRVSESGLFFGMGRTSGTSIADLFEQLKAGKNVNAIPEETGTEAPATETPAAEAVA